MNFNRWLGIALTVLAGIHAERAHAQFSATVIVPGNVVGGTNVVVNASMNSPATFTSATFVLSVPLTGGTRDLTFVSANGVGWTCVPNIANGIVQCDRGGGTPGAYPFTVTYQARATPSSGGLEPSTITYGASTPSPPQSVSNQVANFALDYRVNFALALSLQPTGNIVQGTTRTLRAAISNAPAAFNSWQGVRVDFSLPPQVTFQNVITAGWNCSGTTNVSCNRLSNTAPGAGSENLDINVSGATLGTSTVTASVSTSAQDANPSDNNGSVGVTVVAPSADVRVASASQAPASPVTNGADFNYAVTVTNDGPQSAASVVLLAEPTGGIDLTAPGGCSKVGPNVQCPIASLTALQSQNFSFSARHTTAAPSGTVQTRFSVSSATTDPNPANNENVVVTSITPAADQALQLVAPGSVTLGTEFDVEATVRNNGIDNASTSQVSFALGSRLEYRGAASGSDYSCSTPPASPVTCARTGGLTANTTARARIRVRANTLQGSGTISAVVSSNTLDPVTANNSASRDVSASDGASLRLVKTAGAADVALGGQLRYRLQVSNAGTGEANGLVLLDRLPSSVNFERFISTGAFSCSVANNLIDCRVSVFGAGESQAVEFDVRAPTTPGVFTNTAELSTAQSSASVSSSVSVTALATQADLLLTKTDLADPVAPDGNITYSLEVRNIGSAAATGVSLTDNLPANVTLISANGPGFSCSGNAIVNCSFAGELAAGASASVTLVARAPSNSGAVINRASVSASNDSVVANNSDDETTTISSGSGTAQIDGEVSASPANIALTRGADLNFSFSVRNAGANAISAPQLCLNLGTGASQLENFRLTGATCSDLGNGSFRCDLNGLNAGQTGTIAGSARIAATATLGAQVVIDGVFGRGGQCGNADSNASNDRAQVRVNVVQSQDVDLAVTLTDSADPVSLETEFDLRADVRNLGAVTANQVRAEFTLGTGLSLVRSNGTGWTCSGTAPQVVCTLAQLLPAGQSSVTLTLDPKGAIAAIDSSVRVSSSNTDSVPGNNTATQRTTIARPGSDTVIENAINPLAGLDRFASDAAPVVADLCANPTADLAPQCDAIINAALAGNREDLVEALRALYPQEVISQSLILNQAAATQFSNVDARLNELRGGGGGFSVSGLNIGVGSQIMPMGLLKQMLDQDEEDEATIGESGDLISRWGGFVNGTIARGDQATGAANRRILNDYDSLGITVGADYRMSTRWVIGGALGYADFDSDLEDGGNLSTKGFTLTGYTSFYPLDRLYVDARLSYSTMDLDLKRRILFTAGNFTLDRTALGNTDSSQFALATSAGYHLNSGAWNFTPNASVRFVDSTIDAFTETGAQDNNAVYGEQNFESLQLALGISISRAVSLSNGVITPTFDLSFNHESKGDNRRIGANLVGARAGAPFAVVTDDEDSSFGNAGLGFVYIGPNGRQAYLSYRRLFGSDTLTRDSINVGARFEF
jgi:uncharacterized repeat protein (TIGR01451 family)